jgi:hypothetical protein
MKHYIIDSIELDRCYFTDKNIMKSLKSCENCGKLPIPPYKSLKKNAINVYCKTCYDKEKLDNFVIPNKEDRNILDHVIISCENEICDSEFRINSINEMIDHQISCTKYFIPEEGEVYQIKSSDKLNSKDRLHNNINQNKDNVNINENNKYLLDQIKTYLNKRLDYKINQKLNKIEYLNEVINQHSVRLNKIEEEIINLHNTNSI